jgi:pimeloyl-ACP methyl ester carboxylesterase
LTYAYLHGFASGPESSKASFLKKRFRERGIELLVPQLAPDGLEALTVSGQLAIVGALRPDVLIGSSLGGYLAALYAARSPGVQRLVLLAPAFGFPARWPERLGPEKTAAWQRTGFMEVFHYAEGRPARVGWGLIEDAAAFPPEPLFTQRMLGEDGRFAA